MKTFPKLFKKTNTGAIQEWTISVQGNVITTVFGQVDGKLQTTSETIFEGKSIGKVNQTTPEQQAESESQAKWEKQKKKGYIASLEAAQAGKVDSVIEGGILPMLAPSKIYPHFAKKLKWPVIVQPKLDGSRLIAVLEGGKCSLWSRTRKRVLSLPHIERAVEQQLGQFGDMIIDGECYNAEYAQANGFEGLMSLIRSSEPAPGHEVLQYWVYDVPSCQKPNKLRDTIRADLFTHIPATSPLRFVKGQDCWTHEEVMRAHERNLEAGFEGSMLRNPDGLYEEGKRSYNLQKLKNFVDREWPIEGAEEGRGKDAGTVGAFVCKSDNGDLFKCRLKATYERRRELFQHPEQWKGKLLTVVYQNLTLAGLPRFPIGRALRDGQE